MTNKLLSIENEINRPIFPELHTYALHTYGVPETTFSYSEGSKLKIPQDIAILFYLKT
jgi:hypothetical protein